MSDDGSVLVRLLKGFGRFWWDFLVGDTPEITVAVILIVGAVALASNVMHVNALAYVALPLLAIVTLALSVQRARKSE
ncbi:MAG: hypothetical protein ABSG24_05900 [Acidimicrobiales bacterium]|jgi:hypothetical protein